MEAHDAHAAGPSEDDEAAVREAAFRECASLKGGAGAKETLAKDVLSLVYGVRCLPALLATTACCHEPGL